MNYDELETKVVEAIQTETPKLGDPSFEQTKLLGVVNKSTLQMALGAALAGTVSGALTSAVPQINIFAGVPAIIGGVVIKKFLGSTGLTGDVGDGLMIAGISEAISGLIGSSLLQTRQQRKDRPELESEAPKKNQIAGGVTW